MMLKNRLKEIRTEKEITQLELARLTRIAPSNLSHIENFKQHCYPGWRRRIARALKVPVEEIFPEEVADHVAAGK